jgi:hypothetical protein
MTYPKFGQLTPRRNRAVRPPTVPLVVWLFTSLATALNMATLRPLPPSNPALRLNGPATLGADVVKLTVGLFADRFPAASYALTAMS